MIDRYASLYALADQCEQILALTESLFDRAPSKEHLIVSSLMCRCIDHFKAANLLIKSGLPIEAMTLVRGLFEATFVMGALVRKAVTLAELGDHDLTSRVKMARMADGLLARIGEPSDRAVMAGFAARNSAAKGLIGMERFAKLAQMTDAYDGLYRYLSHFASHPSLSAIETYLVDSPDQTARVARSQREALTIGALRTACAAGLLAASTFEMSEAGTTPRINAAIVAADVVLGNLPH